jgi:hypothetical protein
MMAGEFDPVTFDPTAFANMLVEFRALLDRQDAMQARIVVQVLTGAGPFLLTEAGHGRKRLHISQGGNVPVEVRLPADASIGTVILPRQLGTAPLRFTAAAGAQVRNRLNHNGTAGLYADVAVACERNEGGSSAVWYLSGDTAVIA